jgi:EAL domain-containing protein (putative c-di-GMP-specific phosphodiesterase class I)
LSGRQLLRPELLDRVRRALGDSGLPAPRLRLEITESVIMEDPGPAALLLDDLKRSQVKLVLDDFGTGHSSLAYLHNFHFDTLKIDRSFVEGLDSSHKQAEIVRTIVALARALGMDVVAEGAETEKQVAQLKALGCDAAQGFWFSRPLDGPGFVALLQSGKVWPLPAAVSAA